MEHDYMEGGIYTRNDGTIAICCGLYEAKNEMKQVVFIEPPNCEEDMHDQIVEKMRELKVEELDGLIVVPIDSVEYQFGYLGMLPTDVYANIHLQMPNEIHCFVGNDFIAFAYKNKE